jgi:hypothetical protein
MGKTEEKRPLGRPRRRWWTILKWILERWDGAVWTRLIWHRIGASEGSFDYGNETSGSIKYWEVLE